MPHQTIKRTMDQRRALIAECRRRMQAGEEIKAICTALQINIKTFHKWAKIHGFRRGDIDPDHPRARSRLPPGPSAHTSSGLYMRGEGLGRARSGGRQAVLSPEAEAHFLAHQAEGYLVAVRAEAMGDHRLVNAISKLLRRVKSRGTDMLRLREIAMEDPAYDWGAFQHECMAQWCDAELRARVIFRQMYPDHRRYPGPPEYKRPAQSWIDHFADRARWEHAELTALGRLEPDPPSHEPFSDCHAAQNMSLNPLGTIDHEEAAKRRAASEPGKATCAA